MSSNKEVKKRGRGRPPLSQEEKDKRAVERQIEKLNSMNIPTSRLRIGEVGYLGLKAINDIVNEEMKADLRWPQSLKTFDAMHYHPSVWVALEVQRVMIEKAFSQYKVVGNIESEESKKATEFVNWCLNNMESSMRTAVREAQTAEKYGFSVIVKAYEANTSGEFPEFPYKLKKLSPRAQKSLSSTKPFKFDEDTRTILGCRQSTKNLNTLSSLFFQATEKEDPSDIFIPRNKFMLFAPYSTNGNPLGRSSLVGAYKPWREISLIEDLEVVGVSKDMSGVPVIHAPKAIFDAAATNPNGPEAKSLQMLQQNVANLHAGEQAYIMLPSDVQEGSTTLKEYEIKFLGVEGSGKQFDTTELIEQRHKAILNCFGAGFIMLGQNGSGGSYALGDLQKGLYGQIILNKIEYYAEVFNRELIPQLLALNGIKLKDADMPKIIPGLVDDLDIDNTSKAVQRVAAVGFLPRVPELINEVLEGLDFKYRIPDNMSPEELGRILPEKTSRSGDGMKEGLNNGVGSAQPNQDNDAANLES